MSDTNDNYEQEIRNSSKEYSMALGRHNDFRKGMEKFRDTIHAREMAKKDEEVAELKEAIFFLTPLSEEDDEEKVATIVNPNINMENENGFFDLKISEICKDPGHTPPSHIHISQGKGYRHVCPSCGKVTDLIPPQISF